MKPKNQLSKYALVAALALVAASSASAHLTYGGRTFANIPGGVTPFAQTLFSGAVAGDYGWADGTDADFGDSHRTRAFRFTLLSPGSITITVIGLADGATPALAFPAFSLYSGLAQVAPDASGHDGSASSVAYLGGLGGVPKEGVFEALDTWSIGNDPTYNTPDVPASGIAIPAILKTLSYIGNVADGTSANYGSAAGINGDGNADGAVVETFNLAAGDYTLIVGGGDYSQANLPIEEQDITNRGVQVTIPEPTTVTLLGLSALGLILRRRRRA